MIRPCPFTAKSPRRWPKSWLPTFLLGIVAASRLGIAQTPLAIEDQVRLHQLQWIGTHNSYHIAPHPRLEKWIALAGKSILEGIQYTHRPLQEQLSKLQIRQLELDVYADPKGGLFSKPIGAAMAGASSDAPDLDPNADGAMDQPGFKILHAPGFDYLTRVATLSDAFEQIREWSDRSPGHLPVLVMIELKESSPASAGVSLVPFDRQLLQQLDALIHASFPRQQLLLPIDLKPEGVETIRDAVLQQGWPTLAQARGKLIFALDNEGSWVDRYLDAQEGDRQEATLFVSVEPTHPMAAWMKRNDPVGQFEEIQSLVRRNFMVRTRADADTRQARSGDTSRRDSAWASGAQWISTDFPEPDPRWPDYWVAWPDRQVARWNPLHPPAHRSPIRWEPKIEWSGASKDATETLGR
ncbi:MAG: Ca2+-dependent phosphoinositide-specific phospholipase C [Pirellulaceae bacterium]